MILGELALSATNAQISGFKEPVMIQPTNMPQFPLTIWQRSRTQASFRSAAIKITCEEVTDYSDKDEDAIVIAFSKVVEQFNPVKEFLNLFSKTIPTMLLPLREVHYCINPKPGSEWLPPWRPSAYKFNQQIKDKLNVEVELGCMYPAPND